MSGLSVNARAYLETPSFELAETIIQILDHNTRNEADIPFVIRLINEAPHAGVRCFAWLYLRLLTSRGLDAMDVLNLEPEHLKEALSTDYRQARFPLAGNNGAATVAELFVFPFQSAVPTAIALYDPALQSAQVLAELCGQSFVIVFTEDFCGESWMCAALAALIVTDPLRLGKIAFTGEVLPSGKIISGRNLISKRGAAAEFGLSLISSIKSKAELDFWLNGPELPLPVIQCNGEPAKARLWLKKMETAIVRTFPFFSLQILWELGSINTEDLMIFREGELPFDPDAWQEFLETQVCGRFDSLEKRFTGYHPVFWYAGMISSLQFGIGVIFGFKRPICICHWEPSSQSYIPVIQLRGEADARYLKNVQVPQSEYHHIDWELMDVKDEQDYLTLIIYLGSHNPIKAAQRHARQEYSAQGSLVIRLKESQGHISIEDNWLEIAREINSLINQLKGKYYWSKMLVYQTAPAAICMALGIAFGHFFGALIHHYQPGKDSDYLAVYDLKDLFVL